MDILYTIKYSIYLQLGINWNMRYIYIYTYHTFIFLCFHPTQTMKQSATLPCITMAFSRSPTFCESFFISTFQHGSALGTGKVYRRGSEPGEPWHGTNGKLHGWGCVAEFFFVCLLGKKQQAPGEYSWEFICVGGFFCWKGLVCGWVVCWRRTITWVNWWCW